MDIKSIIITAGGVGKRMGSTIPKQFLEIDGKPILMRTIECFFNYDTNCELIVTLPEDHIDGWKDLCIKHQFSIEHSVVIGGKERFDSIKNALDFCTGAYIAVHDGVRPYVSTRVIETCFEVVKDKLAVVPAIAIHESIRELTSHGSRAVNRENYKIVQTPQVFESSVLRKAYAQEYKSFFTDDASVVEAAGIEISIVEGNVENIKITLATDLT
jgi:2-C-methyl-D-erythritol 4-phosphate cytidylyltransferase